MLNAVLFGTLWLYRDYNGAPARADFFNSPAHISFLTHTLACKAKAGCLYRSVVTGVEQDIGPVTEHTPPCHPDRPSIQLDVPARSTSYLLRQS